jgi:hypothetical protein
LALLASASFPLSGVEDAAAASDAGLAIGVDGASASQPSNAASATVQRERLALRPARRTADFKPGEIVVVIEATPKGTDPVK